MRLANSLGKYSKYHLFGCYYLGKTASPAKDNISLNFTAGNNGVIAVKYSLITC